MVRKALVPIAGLGTRVGPLARAVPKALFPLVDDQGRVRPVVQIIMDEAISAGIERLGLIVSPAHVDLLRRYFTAARKEMDRDPAEWVEYITQPSPAGFGEAVARGAHFVGDEPFMLLLGDHVHRQTPGARPCAQQVAEAHDKLGGLAVVGMQCVGADELPKVGACRGEPVHNNYYRCAEFIEKPSLDMARKRLVTPGLPPDQYLAHCGIYIFTPEIFQCLTRLTLTDRPMGQEIQLADAQTMLLAEHPKDYFLVRIDGHSYDTGSPEGYLAAQAALRA